MMAADKKPWVQALGIPDNSFHSWKLETPKGSSVAYWCLKHQKIDSAAYFQWAREHYALPSLDAEFFQGPAPTELWKQIQSVANWSAELLPLGEWDGTIFVGCAEPTEVQWSFPVQYILAPPHGLERMWNQLNELAVPVAGPPTAAIPPALPEVSLEPIAPPVIEEPEGIRLDFNATVPEPSTGLALVEDAPVSEMPEGLNLVGMKAYPTPPVALPEDFKTVPHIVLGPDGLSAPGKEVELPPAAPIAGAKKSAAESPLEPHIRQVFADLGKMFQRSLFLRFQDKEFHVTSQDGTWPAQEGSGEWFGLQEPSVFRIVSRTGLPYHGYVSSSQFNDDFFKLWGMTSLPEHLTIIPIKINGQVVAAFLAIGGKELNNEKILRQAEKLIEKFSAHLSESDTRAA